jgi:hypothetical protein
MLSEFSECIRWRKHVRFLQVNWIITEAEGQPCVTKDGPHMVNTQCRTSNWCFLNCNMSQRVEISEKRWDRQVVLSRWHNISRPKASNRNAQLCPSPGPQGPNCLLEPIIFQTVLKSIIRFTTYNMNITVCCEGIPCSLVGTFRCFRGVMQSSFMRCPDGRQETNKYSLFYIPSPSEECSLHGPLSWEPHFPRYRTVVVLTH